MYGHAVGIDPVLSTQSFSSVCLFFFLLQNKWCLNKKLFSQRVHSLYPLCCLTSLYYTLNNCIADDDLRHGGWETEQQRHRHNTSGSKQNIWPIHINQIQKCSVTSKCLLLHIYRPFMIEEKKHKSIWKKL